MTAAELDAMRARWTADTGAAAKDCLRLLDEHAVMLANLTSVQARCTELLLELRDVERPTVLDHLQAAADRNCWGRITKVVVYTDGGTTPRFIMEP